METRSNSDHLLKQREVEQLEQQMQLLKVTSHLQTEQETKNLLQHKMQNLAIDNEQLSIMES